MKKASLLQHDEEEDIWEYRPLRLQKRRRTARLVDGGDEVAGTGKRDRDSIYLQFSGTSDGSGKLMNHKQQNDNEDFHDTALFNTSPDSDIFSLSNCATPLLERDEETENESSYKTVSHNSSDALLDIGERCKINSSSQEWSQNETTNLNCKEVGIVDVCEDCTDLEGRTTSTEELPKHNIFGLLKCSPETVLLPKALKASKKNTSSKKLQNLVCHAKMSQRKHQNKYQESGNSTKQISITSFFKPARQNSVLNEDFSSLPENDSSETMKLCAKSKVQQNSSATIQDEGQKKKDLLKFNQLFERKKSLPENQYTTKETANKYNNAGWHSKKQQRNCPFYKRIPESTITVDAFSYGVIPNCHAYFLTHFHYDHYGGLTSKFCQPIYCSKVTANLVRLKLNVAPEWIHPFPLYTPQIIENVEVTLMDANHCPGSVMILFKLCNGQMILHTGDFRANPLMEECTYLKGTKIHQLYLDTTYCDPAYNFPPQKQVVEFSVALARKAVAENPKTLIVCGTYTIGKEKIFLAIAKALNCKIGVSRDKRKILDCLEKPELKSIITLDMTGAGVHVLPMSKLNYRDLSIHLKNYSPKFCNILALQPTGWTHNDATTHLSLLKPTYNRNGIKIYGVPYSEHSSFLELKRFVMYVQPAKILPTVNNGNAKCRKAMQTIFNTWLNEPRMEEGNFLKQSTIDTNRN